MRRFGSPARGRAHFGARLGFPRPRLIGKHGDWEAFTEREDGKTCCYMGSIECGVNVFQMAEGPM